MIKKYLKYFNNSGRVIKNKPSGNKGLSHLNIGGFYIYTPCKRKIIIFADNIFKIIN